MRQRGRCTTALLAASAALLSTAAPAGAAPSATSLLQSAMAAAAQQHSVTIVVTSSYGPSHSTSTYRAGLTQGSVVEHTITGNAELRQVGASAYLNADAAFLQSHFGTGAELAGDWISMPTRGKTFSQLNEGAPLTLSAQLASTPPSGTLMLVTKSSFGGRAAMAIVGSANPLQHLPFPVTATLFVSTSAPHLPLGERFTGTYRHLELVGTAVFTGWGAKVSIVAPKAAIAVARTPLPH